MSVLGIVAACAAGAFGGAIGASMAKSDFDFDSGGMGYDDSRLIDAIGELKYSVNNLNRSVEKISEDLELEATVSLNDYNAYKVHEAAAADLMAVSRMLAYAVERTGIAAMRCSGMASIMDEYRFHWSHAPSTDKLLRYGDQSAVRAVLEILYVSRLIHESVVQAPKFCETTHWDGKGTSVKLRGAKAEKYLSHKYVILNIQDLLPLLRQCSIVVDNRAGRWDDEYFTPVQHPLLEYVADRRNSWDAPRLPSSFAPSPAKRADLKFLHVEGGCLDMYSPGRVWIGKYGDDGDRFRLDMDTLKSMFGSKNKLENNN